MSSANPAVQIAALRYVVSIALAQLYAAQGMSSDDVDALQATTLRRLEEQSLAKISDPALSDLRSAEILEEIGVLLKAAADVHRAGKRTQSS